MNTIPALLPMEAAGEAAPPPKLHPIDIALAALTEFAAETLVSGRPSRFAELQRVITIAAHVQALRVPTSVEDADNKMFEGGNVGGMIGGFGDGLPMPEPPMHRYVHRGVRFNDGADLNREIIMVAQQYLAHTLDAEKKKTVPDNRLDAVAELAKLIELRAKLVLADQDVPPEIGYRIDTLLKRIGEPSHAPEPDPGPAPVPADDLRRREADGAGQPDGGRVGEPLAERAAGDGLAR
jgi:hypothetical protein